MSKDQKTMRLASLELETIRFETHIKRFIDMYNSPRGAEPIRAIKQDFLARVMDKNPVRTGRSRAGWFRAAEAVGLATPGGPDAAMVAKGRSEGMVRMVLTGPRKAIESVNRVPYIAALEYGASSQAPQGMIRLSMREVRTNLKPRLIEGLIEIWKTTRT